MAEIYAGWDSFFYRSNGGTGTSAEIFAGVSIQLALRKKNTIVTIKSVRACATHLSPEVAKAAGRFKIASLS